jgi:hypothetical protein
VKKRFSFLLILVLLIPLLSGCSSSLKASLDSQFTLAPSQSAQIDSESMDIKFIAVTQDSRCPTGVECIRAGDVSCSIEITQNGIKSPVTLTITGGNNEIQGFASQNYIIAASVLPYPVYKKTIAKGDYRLTLSVSKLARQ